MTDAQHLQGNRGPVGMWNRMLTAENPSFNTDPNAFLVSMVEGRKPGRALDAAMGQGRNAIWLAQEGWEVTGFDTADKAVALAHELADKAGVKITTEVISMEEFNWGEERWDLVVLSYIHPRERIESIHRSLRPGGWVILEGFHADARRGEVYETNELLETFSGFRILHYEDTTAPPDFGPGETRIVRLLAMKE